MNSFKHPRIVIGVPVYNEGKHIEQTLQSLQNQTIKDFLVVVSDNASTDQTSPVCKAFCAKDQRFIYVGQTKNIGASKNFNYLLINSNAPYFMWMGGHDLLHPKFLSKHLSFLEDHNDFVLSYSWTQFVDCDGRPTKVTNAGGYSEFNELYPWNRYFTFMKLNAECTPINQVFRTDAMRGINFNAVRSSDRIILSRLFFKGKFHCYEEPLYFAREVKIMGHSYYEEAMVRMTGDANAQANLFKTFRAWISDCLSLEPNVARQFILSFRFVIHFMTAYRIGHYLIRKLQIGVRKIIPNSVKSSLKSVRRKY